MDNLQIITGEKRIPIVRDSVPAGELVFNPSDVLFAEKFYRLLGDFQSKTKDFEAKEKEIEKTTGNDANGIPLNAGARIELVKEICTYFHEQIDWVFGANTSAMVFGGVCSFDAIEQFFLGVQPFIQTARSAKLEKYTTNRRPQSKRKQKP